MRVFAIIALRNLVQARRRTFLLGLALGAVTAMLVLLLSLSRGIGDTMIRSATTLASGHVNVGGFFKATSSDASPIVKDVSKLRALIEEEVEGVELVVDRARGWARIVSPEGSLQAGLTGVDVEEETRLLETLEPAPLGDYLEDTDLSEAEAATVEGDLHDLAKGPGAVVFAAQARRLGVRVGDPLTIVAETLQGQRNSAEVTIVAIAKDIGFMSNFSVFLDKESVRKLYRLGPDVSGVVQVHLADHRRANTVMEGLRTTLEGHGYELMPHEPAPFFAKFGVVSNEAWTGQRLDLTVWEDEVSFLRWILTALDTLSLTLVSTLLVIIGVGITNSMWISVRERTNEIGTLRAIGMGRNQVLGMFLLEAVILGVVATGLGALFGAGLASGIDAAHIRIPVDAVRVVLLSDVLHLVVVPSQVLASVLGLSLVASLAAAWPAIAAARLQPVTAIHKVG